MTFVPIYVGASAGDGTGDNLRAFALKVNQNFETAQAELDQRATLATVAEALGDGAIPTERIMNKAVTRPKMADMATASVLGRLTAGSGEPEEITLANLRKAMGVLATGKQGPTATTSGTSIDFTGIPADCKRIRLTYAAVSVNATADIIVQIGDSGGIETSGYVGSQGYLNNAGASEEGDLSTGFSIIGGTGGAATLITGRIDLTLHDAATNTWIATAIGGTGPTSTIVAFVAGSKALSAMLDRVRLTTVAGTATFDNGSVSVSYDYE